MMKNNNNVFLDCGTNLGQGLLQFIDKNIIDKTFKIYCFEPNPYALEFSRKRFSDKKYEDFNITFKEVGVWVENCEKNLTIECFSGEYTCQHTKQHLGYNLKSGGATNIMENEWLKPDYIEDKDIDKSLNVQCIDFSEYIKQNINPTDYVICKMDIEGAEYEVLQKMIKDETINIIKELYIEWHSHLLKTNYNTFSLIQEMTKRGIRVNNWI